MRETAGRVFVLTATVGRRVLRRGNRIMLKLWYTATLLALALALPAMPSRAGEAREEVAAHVAKAKEHLRLHEYERAAEEYVLAYQIKPTRTILSEIADAYERAGKHEKAREFHLSYLRETTDPKAQAGARKRIERLDDLIAKQTGRAVTLTSYFPGAHGR